MPEPGDLDPEELEAAGRRALAWLGDYLAHPERHAVLSRVRPGDFARALPASPPAEGQPLAAILDDFERLVPPALTHWNHPGFLAYFANTGSIPGIVAETLAAGLNVNAMLWRTSPAATELEQTTLDWLRQALGLAGPRFGLIADTASMASLLALLAAREATFPEVRRRGLAALAATPRVYASEQAHSSIDKAVIALGLGLDNLVKVPVDAAWRMDVAALGRLVAEDVARGFTPLAVVATAGTTSTTSVDPIPALAELAERHRLWLHVDAAYAGAAAVVPELRWVLDGAGRADSLVVNPHKWLFTPMDLSCLWLRRPELLRRAASLVPDYLKAPETDVVNLMDYGLQLGRRFRALKLWFVLRAYGTRGLAERIRAHVALARDLAARIDAHPDLERLAPAPLSVVCFRVRPAAWRGREDEPAVTARLDRLNEAVLERVNASGEVFLSSTRLAGRLALRLAIGNIRTGRRHVERALDLVLASAAVA